MPGVSIAETIQPPKKFDRLWAAFEPQIPNDRGWRVASLDPYFDTVTGAPDAQREFTAPAGDRSVLATTASQKSSRPITFAERFAAVTDWPDTGPAGETDGHANSMLASSPNPGGHAADRRVGRTGRIQLASLSPAGISKKQLSDAAEDSSQPAGDDGHTAIYDISAHKVYLPNGRTLEAHSGLGKRLDDPRYVRDKDLGPTPPNVYDLSLREEPFHGVHALRLTPTGNGNMFGRDGLLAHSYMLGPNGQSNGCVSFSDYQAFLDAYLGGEITRLVVVDHLETAPGSSTVAAKISETLKSLFGRS